jgi:ribosomal RNA-processing protein 12
LTLSSPHLTLATLTLLSHLFSASLSADSLSANHVEETLAALVGARPKGVQGEGEGGEKLVGGWVEGVGEGMVAFARTNPAAALNYTATLFPSVIPLLASATTPALRQAVESSLELMIKHCVPDSEVEGALVLAEARGPIAVAGTATPSAKSGKEKKVVVAGTVLIDLIELIEKSLTSPRYAANALPHVLGISESLFLRLRLRSTSNATRSEPSATILLSKLLLLIGHQREEPRFEWKREADVVLSTATKVCGPAHLLALLPLGLTTDMVNPTKARAWLLPLLKPSITNTSLAHFKSYWVPLSAHLFSKAEDARKGDGGGMEAKVWETLVGQIWSLLSGYCEYSTDLIEAFDTTFVSLLGNILYTQSTLRPPIFKALSTLLTTTSSLASSTSPPELLQAQFGLTPAEGQLSLDHLRTLSTDILSMSFNVYAQQPRGEGAYIIDCITNWFSILSPSDLVSTYTRISTLLTQALAAAPAARPTKGHGAPSAAAADENIPPTHALLDILLALIPHAPASSPVRKALFGFALGDAVLGAEDAGVQKKGYRILARLLEGHEGVVDLGEGVGEVLEKLVEGREQVAQGAKRVSTASIRYLESARLTSVVYRTELSFCLLSFPCFLPTLSTTSPPSSLRPSSAPRNPTSAHDRRPTTCLCRWGRR